MKVIWVIICLSWMGLASAQDGQCLSLMQARVELSQGLTLGAIHLQNGDFLGVTGPHIPLDERIGKHMSIDDIDAVLSQIRDAYFAAGYFRAQVQGCLTRQQQEPGVYDLRVDVIPGVLAQVRTIEFKGTKSFPKSMLEGIIASKRYGVISQILGLTGYGMLRIEDDKKRILEFYRSQGYLDVQLMKTLLVASDNMDFCELEFHIDEGKLYRLGQITPEKWQKDVTLKSGDIFDMPRLNDDIEELLRPSRDEGFAFARAQRELTVKNDVVSVQYELEKGEKVRIAAVIVKGNKLTNSDIIIREFRSIVGNSYSLSAIDSLRHRLMARGNYSDVQVSLAKTETDGTYDLVVKVTEKFPMRFNFYPRYFRGEGFYVSAYALHQNILGRGIYGILATQLSSLRQTFELMLYDPYFGEHDLSWLTEVHARHLGHFSFTSNTLGGGLRTGFRVNDLTTMQVGATLEEVSATVNAPSELFAPWVKIPKNETKSSVNIGVAVEAFGNVGSKSSYLVLDSQLTYSGVLSLSEFDYAEFAGGVRWGISLSPFEFRGRLSASFITPTGNELLPISERYFLGGQNSLRGYQVYSVAPWLQADALTPAIQVGGVSQIMQSVEVEFPIFQPIDLRGYVFSDMGNAFLENQRFLEGGLALSIGFGLTATIWRFPLKCELSLPLANVPGALFPFDLYLGFSSVSF